jgi:hypothetical protein
MSHGGRVRRRSPLLRFSLPAEGTRRKSADSQFTPLLPSGNLLHKCGKEREGRDFPLVKRNKDGHDICIYLLLVWPTLATQKYDSRPLLQHTPVNLLYRSY